MNQKICHAITIKNTPCKLPSTITINNQHYCKKHSSIYKYEKPSTCSICLDDISNEIRPTKCGHYFHSSCMKNWSKNKSIVNCPTCRTVLKQKKNNHMLKIFVEILSSTTQESSVLQSTIREQNIEEVILDQLMNYLNQFRI